MTEDWRCFQLFIRTLTGKTITMDIIEDMTVYELKQKIHSDFDILISVEQQRLIYNGKELSDNQYILFDYGVEPETTINLLLRLNGGRLHGQVLQKSLLYMRPRGFMGMKQEKLHCLMMSKLVNTRQIHLLTLVKYFYARMALFHNHPSKYPTRFGRTRAAESQIRPFQFPKH